MILSGLSVSETSYTRKMRLTIPDETGSNAVGESNERESKNSDTSNPGHEISPNIEVVGQVVDVYRQESGAISIDSRRASRDAYIIMAMKVPYGIWSNVV